jgi:hypothetical protein
VPALGTRSCPVRRIGYDHNQRIVSGVVILGDDILVNRSIRFEQAEPSDKIAAIGCGSTLLVDPGSHHNQRRSGQI